MTLDDLKGNFSCFNLSKSDIRETWHVLAKVLYGPKYESKSVVAYNVNYVL